MNGTADLTRWNRAGLARFRYLDGNAALYLEELRLSLVERFSVWRDLAVAPPAGEGDAARLARLLAQYFEEEPGDSAAVGRTREAVIRLRRDPAWQIARAAARAVHVVGEHLDAYANEGFLRTATERENLRRLVALLDFHPAPPASAATVLVLTAQGEPGTVPAGFAVQHTPPDGGPPIVFETRAEVAVDPALNALRLAGWNRSDATLGAPGPSPWIAGAGSKVAAGQLALLVQEGPPEGAAVVTVAQVEADSRRITFKKEGIQPPPWNGWKRGQTRLLARPELVARPRPHGPEAVSFTAANDLAAGEVVAWQKTGRDWTFAKVSAVGESTARLSGALPPAPGTAVFRALLLERNVAGRILLPLSSQAVAKPGAGGFEALNLDRDVETVPDTDLLFKGLLRVKDSGTPEVRFVPKEAAEVGRVAAAPVAEILFDGKPGRLAAGQWAVADDGRGGLRALRLTSLSEREDHYAVTFAPDPGALVRLHAVFAETLRPEGHDRNTTPIDESTQFKLDLAATGGALPPLLAPGRELVLERQEGAAGARRARVVRVDAATIEIAPAVRRDEGFLVGTTVLRGNLAAAGHGEARPESVLGGGDATQAGQTFVLAEPDVSFVADSTQPSGVRADVEVRVEGAVWEQVATLRDAGPTDPRYTVRLTEDGFLAVGFGDGRNGRRLPTGVDNVRIRFRAGAGLTGNLPPGSLVQPRQPHHRVAAVRQPFAATGGNDREPLESLRANAPASVLTLERAVSLADLTHLAARQASVWQARAFPRSTLRGRQASVDVVVVPAGGGELGDLAVTLRDVLAAHALPGVDVRVVPFAPQALDLSITVQAESRRFDLAEVGERVRAALLDAFSLRRRGLGQDLFLSEVVAVVEGVPGVESSASVLAGKPGLRRLVATSERHVIHLDRQLPQLAVVVQELAL